MAGELIFMRRDQRTPHLAPRELPPAGGKVRRWGRPQAQPVSASFSSSVSFASSFPSPPAFKTGVDFSHSFAAADKFGRISSTAHLRSRFRVTNQGLANGRYRRAANSFVETPQGLLLVASGFDRMLRWDGFEDQAQVAGIAAPSTAVTLGGSGGGNLRGDYYAYVRYLDSEGNVSNFSPISTLFEAIGLTYIVASVNELPGFLVALALVPVSLTGAVVTIKTSTGRVVPVRSEMLEHHVLVETTTPHALLDSYKVKISGVGGADALNGEWDIIVVNEYLFLVKNLSGLEPYKTGGTIEVGVASFSYTNVPSTDNPRVTRRQILRNTAGQATTFYVDVDSEDLTSTSFTSTRTDTQLSVQESQALLDVDGSPLANAHTPPPDIKSVLSHHLDRAFAAGEVEYREGNVSVTLGSTSVTGIGTEWTGVVAGRFLHVQGARKAHEISSVDVPNQTLTLTEAYTGATAGYADYAIRPPAPDRRTVYFSEAGKPESWPATNALSLQEDGDQITGLMQKDSFLYILERRHVYRFTAQSNPAQDGFVFLASRRGCVNHRSWVIIEDSAFMLDEQGIHRFGDGREPEQVSQPITAFFDGSDPVWRINWQAKNHFHACHFAQQECIKWFVAFGGSGSPKHALCLDYRLSRWWVEEYPFPVGASCLGRLTGLPQAYLGSEARRVFAAEQGTLDGVDAGRGTVRGTVTSAGLLSLSDSLASFDTSLAGVPVVITSGRGKGQLRMVISAAATALTLSEPWSILPDTTSTYQVGGIPWKWRSGWFRFVNPRERSSGRRIEVIYKPLAHSATVDMRYRRDRQEEWQEWDRTLKGADNNGVAVRQGETDLEGDLTRTIGHLQQRYDHHKELYTDGPRDVQWELGGVQNQELVEIYQVILEGAEQGQ